MKYRKLSSTGWSVSELGIGTFPFKGWWGEPLSDEVCREIVQKAIELGVNLIDTADVYGLGEAERIVGELLPTVKQKVYVVTKGGRDFTSKPGEITKNFEVDYLSHALDASLNRLKMDCVDIYYLHGPSKQDISDGMIFRFLDRVKSEGKIKLSGISVADASEIPLILGRYKPDLISLIGNILCPYDLGKIVEDCTKVEVDVVFREPLEQGLLTGKHTSKSYFPETDHRSRKWNEEFWQKKKNGAKEFSTIDFGEITKVQAALAYDLSFQEVKSVVFGAKSVKQVEENCTASEVRLSESDLIAIDNIRKKVI